MPNARFRIINTQLSGTEFLLPDEPAIVGRIPPADIVLSHPSVSRQHVRAEVKNGHCILTDLGSQNGIVIGDQTLREAMIPHGGRFELGDVAIEFTADQPAEPAPPLPEEEPVPAPEAPPAPATADQFAVATPGAALAERPVYVDDIFGAAAMEPEAGPGDEEKAAVEGARSAARYFVFVGLLVLIGAVAWQVAGARSDDVRVIPVLVKVGQTVAIDLGEVTEMRSKGLVTYYDGRQIFDDFGFMDEDGEGYADFDLDRERTGFIARIEGLNEGSTDVRVTGPSRRRVIVRILVRGVVPRPPGEEDMNDAQRIATARELIASGDALCQADQAAREGYVYRAIKKYKNAEIILEPVQTDSGITLRDEAYNRFLAAKKQIDDQFEEIKTRAMAKYRSRDRLGALKDFDDLRLLVDEDETDPRYQELRIIYNRTVNEIQRKGG